MAQRACARARDIRRSAHVGGVLTMALRAPRVHRYRNLALKWHPLRCEEADAQANFDEVSEAFEVLANYELRALFDKFGEIALKEGVSDGNGGFLGGNYAYGFNGSEIFESFFGTSNPFASIVEAATTIDVNAPVVVEPESVQTVMPCPRTSRHMFQLAHGAGCSWQIFESITLEDVHQGARKSVALGSRVLNFDVKPTFTSGSQLVFTDDDSGVGACRPCASLGFLTAVAHTGWHLTDRRCFELAAKRR